MSDWSHPAHLLHVEAEGRRINLTVAKIAAAGDGAHEARQDCGATAEAMPYHTLPQTPRKGGTP